MRAATKRLGKLNEAQAWHTIELRFWDRTGLCAAVRALEKKSIITVATATQMRKRIAQEARNQQRGGRPHIGYLWPLVRYGVDERRLSFIARCLRKIEHEL